ncbi:MAG: hypothetical protein HC833_24505 [Leptolyngbyaceae cyanobacterium RM1_406_9]|nr:hypothetical protein [Leptolyngbyaceae cyanobacterium RM1_406_9]
MTTPPSAPSTITTNWEYLKTLISVFAGFITAFLAEPVKVYFTNRAKKNNLRRSLYGEILNIYSSLSNFLVSIEERGIQIPFLKVVDTNFNCYNFAKSDPTLFYQLKEANSVNQIYSNIELLKQEHETGVESDKAVSLVKLVILQIELLLTTKKFDKKTVLKYCTGLPIESRIKELLSGRIRAGETASLHRGSRNSR